MQATSLEAQHNKNLDTKWIVIIGLLIIFVAILHYMTPVDLHHLHDLFRVFFYIPIILAAFRYQLKGGLISAAAVLVIYYPHVAFQWGGDFLYNFSRFLQMVMYMVIGIVTGILARRERNERLLYQQAASKLERSYEQLKGQSEKLTEIEDQLRHSERLSVLGELSASLAHEVRNPLGSIWGVVEILQDKFKNEHNVSEFMEILVKEVKRLNDVVENYLNLARKTKPVLKSCNLFEIVQSVIFLLNSKARKHNINLNIDSPDQQIFIKADENQLRQILINLILNSITSISASGSITIKAEIESAKPAAGDDLNLQLVNLSVIDNGRGIKKEMIDKICKPFYTTKEEGTGIGLSIVKRIADQNKWKIKVTSKLNHGTTITLIIPLEKTNDGNV
jgi:signal transduction histidine kinase